jgi:hypothetical protein
MSDIKLETISPQELKIIDWFKSFNLINVISDFVEREDSYTRFVSGIMGWQWEDEFMASCELRDFVCVKDGLNSRHDLTVNGKKVQCKFSASKDRVDIRNKDKTFNRRYRPGDFDYMALKSLDDVYIVPIGALLTKDLTETRQSVRISEIAHFHEKYEVFDVQDTSECGKEQG